MSKLDGCLHCLIPTAKLSGRGLCGRCQRSEGIRSRYLLLDKPPASACGHCHDRIGNRELRGLCWVCHQDPRVRKFYPPLSRAKAEGKPLTDDEILALPITGPADFDSSPAELVAGICSKCGGGTRPHNNGDRPPAICKRCKTAPQKYTNDDETLIGKCFEQWSHYTGTSALMLDSTTSPEAIAASQRRAIARFLASNRGATSKQISEAVLLPVWIVENRVKELKGSRKRATA